ncbi:hypothetical protein P8452_26301 [Trifolium repens]|nr:hypothetical protein P8452_26301 [Trifolium repens]
MSSPCAACKNQRRKCTKECIFAPYFPPDNPQKFAYVQKVFGASNVAKLLNELQNQLRNLQNELVMAKKELASLHAIVPLPPQPPLTPPAATGSSYFSFSSSSAQQKHEVFNFEDVEGRKRESLIRLNSYQSDTNRCKEQILQYKKGS